MFLELALPGFLEMDCDRAFEKKVQITSGSFGSVWLVEMLDANMRSAHQTNQAIAKIANVVGVDDNQRQQEAFIQEVCCLYYFNKRSPQYFAQIYGYDVSKQTLIMRFYKLGSLCSYRKVVTRVSKLQLKTIVKDICIAVSVMHQEGFAHCDLKSDNILLNFDKKDNRIHALLTDLGISKIVDTKRVQAVNGLKLVRIQGLSMRYAAPEVILNFLHHQIAQQLGKQPDDGDSDPQSVDQRAADIYSVGCLVLECLNGDRPWSI